MNAQLKDTRSAEQLKLVDQHEMLVMLAERIKLIGQNIFGQQAMYQTETKSLPRFSAWERDFVNSVRCQIEHMDKAMSPKQEVIVRKLMKKAFEGNFVVYSK